MAISGPSGSRVLTWLAQGYTNYNMGLYRPYLAQRLDAPALNRMIEQLSQSIPSATALQLVDQPSAWNGRPNPFVLLPQQPSANVAFEMPLMRDPDELIRKTLSRDTRRRLERHERRLHEMHQAEFAVAQTRDMRLETLSAFLKQRAAQFARMGVPNIFSDPAVEDFYRILFTEETGGHFENAYLKIDGEIIATSNGMRFQDRFYHLTLSMKLDVLENLSPGRLLSREHIARQCRDGVAMFDFGPGGGMHKSTWHPNELSYFETYLPLRRSAIPLALFRRTLARCRYAVLSSPAIQRAIKRAKSSKNDLVRRMRRATPRN
jgi:CelD/BcsL family acetyltransferase involved in cellulose biosynthesis